MRIQLRVLLFHYGQCKAVELPGRSQQGYPTLQRACFGRGAGGLIHFLHQVPVLVTAVTALAQMRCELAGGLFVQVRHLEGHHFLDFAAGDTAHVMVWHRRLTKVTYRAEAYHEDSQGGRHGRLPGQHLSAPLASEPIRKPADFSGGASIPWVAVRIHRFGGIAPQGILWRHRHGDLCFCCLSLFIVAGPHNVC